MYEWQVVRIISYILFRFCYFRYVILSITSIAHKLPNIDTSTQWTSRSTQ